MSSFRLALLNLTRHRIPTLIAICSISIAVASGGILLKLYKLSQSRFSTIARGVDAIVGAKADSLDILLGSLNLEGPYPGFVPYNLYLTLKARVPVHFSDGGTSKPTYLKGIAPFLYFAKFHRFRVIGTSQSFLHLPAKPLTLLSGQWCATIGEAVVGAGVANSAGLKLGDAIHANVWDSAKPRRDTIPLRVVGILNQTHSMWDDGVYTSLTQAHQVLAEYPPNEQTVWNDNVLSYFLLNLKPGGLQRLKRLINQRTVSQVISAPHELDRLRKLTGAGASLGLFMTLAIMLAAGLTVAAMMVTRFDAMGVQLAILRAIGYSQAQIAGWLLWEGTMLGASAIIIGASLDALFFPWIRGMLGTTLPASDVVSMAIWQSAPVWITAMATTILAVVVPLIRLYRQDVHLSLKGL